MKTLKEIREDLKNIRYYYAHKASFDRASQEIGINRLLDKVKEYNDVMVSSPPQLYHIYVLLYVENNTIESLADKEGYSYVHMQRLSNKVAVYLQENLGGDK